MQVLWNSPEFSGLLYDVAHHALDVLNDLADLGQLLLGLVSSLDTCRPGPRADSVPSRADASAMPFPDSTACFRPQENGQLLTKFDRFTTIPRQISTDCSRFAPHNRPTPYKQRLRKFRITSFIRQSHHPASWPPSPDRERCSDLSVHILTQYTTHSHHCQQATALPATAQLIRPPVSQNHSDLVDWWLICSTNAVR